MDADDRKVQETLSGRRAYGKERRCRSRIAGVSGDVTTTYRKET